MQSAIGTLLYLNPQPKRHLNWFSCFCTAHHRMSLYFTMGCPFSHQNFHVPWRIQTLSNNGSLDPQESFQPKRHLDRVIRFCRTQLWWTTRQTDRQTDRPTDQAARSVTTGRIYAGYVVLRFGLKADVINTTLSNLCSISNLFCYTFTLCNTEEFGIGLLLPPWFWEFIKTFKQVWRQQICLFIKNR